MVFDTKTAVKTFAIKPMTNVTAKPRTGPSPKRKRKAQDTTVVTWVSTMVHHALRKPLSTAAITLLPVRNSSGMGSKISALEYTAIPMVRMIPAMPGRVRTAWKYDTAANRMTVLSASASTALTRSEEHTSELQSLRHLVC